jgi:sugar lactone lactonase YvrE
MAILTTALVRRYVYHVGEPAVFGVDDTSLYRDPASSAFKSFGQPGRFVTILARDGAGNVWIGTEGNGVWRFSPNASNNDQWTHFTTTNGLGDDCAYSLAVDQQGRVWAGHLNHGVSVYNGAGWKNYDIPLGPIGERIFKIAVCPKDGDVWMGTSAGLTRYSVSRDEWTQYTRADGLPGDQTSAIAFDAKGNIYVGMQCHGIAMAKAATGYRGWTVVPGPETPPLPPVGSGLPTCQINDLLVARDGKIFAATMAGLAQSPDSGKTWTYKRGRDYADKVQGLAEGPPKGWEAADPQVMEKLPPEDDVTCLAEDASGLIWLGFRREGCLAAEPHDHLPVFRGEHKVNGLPDDDVSAILPMPDFKPFMGGYGGGLAQCTFALKRRGSGEKTVAAATGAVSSPEVFPSPARAPGLAELNSLLKEVEAVPVARLTDGAVVALEDDWRTEGQWQGRYGRFWIVLCANWSPKDDVWGSGWDVKYDARIGLDHDPGDSLRYWVHWLATADNRCLEMSPTYLDSRVQKKLTTWDMDRRESEWDDHGETYSMNKDGPHIYCSLSIPAGLFYLSLYEVNPNGHEGDTRFRDYTLSIRQHPGRQSLDQQIGNTTIMRSFYDIEEFDRKPELARARASDFYGGVYKRFLVRGPAKLTVQVNRNYSFNTILPGVMLDLVDELPPPYYQTREQWETSEARREEKTMEIPSSPFIPATSAEDAANRLAQDLSEMPCRNAIWWAENKRRIYLTLLRWQLSETALTNSLALAGSYYELNFFSEWEKQLHTRGITTAREIEKALRWDGVTYSCAGMGNKMISEYVQAHPDIKIQSLGQTTRF